MALLAGACASGSGRTNDKDLAENRRLYQPTGFKAQIEGHHTVFLDSVADKREPPPTLYDGYARPEYLPENFWARPVPHMVRDVLLKEIGEAHIFKQVVDTPEQADIVIRPSLLTFYASLEERMAGRRMRAMSRVMLEVLGPPGPDGVRPKVFEQIYTGGELQQEGLGFSADPYAFVGGSLKISVANLLRDLDSRRIGREIPAEASVRRTETVDFGAPGAERRQPPAAESAPASRATGDLPDLSRLPVPAAGSAGAGSGR